MASSAFHVVCLVMGVLSRAWGHRHEKVSGYNKHISTQAVDGLPPWDLVNKGLEAATAHAKQAEEDKMNELAVMVNQTEHAVNTFNDQHVGEQHLQHLNGAIRRSRLAQELQIKVKEHKDLVTQFFDAISEFHKNKVDEEQLHRDMDVRHKAERARTTKEFDGAMEEMREARYKHYQSHNKDEIGEVGKLVDLSDKITSSLGEIQTKDAELGAQVHSAVQHGTHSMKQWANSELEHVCDKYLQLRDTDVGGDFEIVNPEVKAVIKQVKGGEGGKEAKPLFKAGTLCEEVVKALVKKFPAPA